MEETVEKVQQHCALQIKLYSKCIDLNPYNWNINCKNEKTALTICAEDNVKDLAKVKRFCGRYVDEYQSCIQNNDEEPGKCQEPLEKLYQCHKHS